jgi:hypothetical protein
MPTAAKLAALVAFLAIGYAATEAYRALLPEGMRTGLLLPVNLVVAAWCGWSVLGRAAGRGYAPAASAALGTAAVTMFHVLWIWAGWEMMQKATRLRYDGPVEALWHMLGYAMDYAALGLGDARFLSVMLLGALSAGAVTEFVSRRLA